MYNLFLDDERKPMDVVWINLPLVNWIIVRNYNEFIRIIIESGLPERVSFDHDLAMEHYPGGMGIYEGDPRIKTIKLDYDSYKEKTGYHCALFLVNYCIDHNLPLPTYYIHTLNPVGRMNIISVMESAKKIIKL
jgi:hypothetical protein